MVPRILKALSDMNDYMEPNSSKSAGSGQMSGLPKI